jgi:hypothetical protein
VSNTPGCHPAAWPDHAAAALSLQAVKKQAKGWLAGLRDKLRSPSTLHRSNSGLSRASASNVSSLMRSFSGTSWDMGSVHSGDSRPSSAAPGGLLARAFRRKKQESNLSEDSVLVRANPPASRGTASSEVNRRAAVGQGNKVAPGPVGEGREEEQQLLQQRGQQEQGQGRGRSWLRWLGLGGRQAPVFDPSGLPHGMEWVSELDAAELEEVAQVRARRTAPDCASPDHASPPQQKWCMPLQIWRSS